jgi:hypothetical protein
VPSPLVNPPPVPPIKLSRLPRAELAALIQALTVTDYAPEGWPVIWQVDPLPFVGLVNDTLGAYIELGISAFRGIGVDDYRQVLLEDEVTNASVFYGLRAFTLTLDCRSFAPDIPAWDILEGVRLQLGSPKSATVQQVFPKSGLAFVRTHPTVNLNYVDKGDADNRMIWRALMDVELTWLSKAQTTDDPGRTIATVGAPDSPEGTAVIPGTISPAR